MDEPSKLPDVFSLREIADAADVPLWRARLALTANGIEDSHGEFFASAEAVALARLLACRTSRAAGTFDGRVLSGGALFTPPPVIRRPTGVPLALSGTLHAAFFAAAVALTTAGLGSAEPERVATPAEPVRLVYLALPGPGGGGGGGGLRQLTPPPKAQRKGTRKVSSPLPARQEPKLPVETQVREEPPPLVPSEPLPPVIAPIITAPADSSDRIGALEESAAESASHGPGSGGGVGTGSGTGLGEGQGSGVGEGSGGGTGGGPYRPGSGIEPPRLLHETKPSYTDEARRRGITGDVLMEIVVRSNGTVGEVRVIQGLGYGLDQRAIDAVRLWRFAPARRLGRPVDVLVEVAVEFKLR
jgi:TonB family protein